MEPNDPNDDRLDNMINGVLKLNHKILIGRRLEAFKRADVGIGSSNPLTVSKSRTLAKSVVEFKDGKLTPFCIAIARAAVAHAELVEKRAKHKRQSMGSG